MAFRRVRPLCVMMLGTMVMAVGLVTASVAEGVRQDVPFLTVRDPGSTDGPSAYFGDARSSLRAGRCRLEAVDTGGLASVIESGPTFIREQLLQIEQVTTSSPADVIESVKGEPAASPVLYVHGYFIDFEKGCRRAALLQRNAQIEGRMVWFSWPSDGDIANYARDEADLYWSVLDIADAIVAVNAHSSGSGTADIIGHSLGGRGVALALYEVANRHPDIRLGQVVLLAPDMDFGIFARLLPRISPIVDGITIYVSDEDRPLAISEQLHGYPRLGQSGNDVTTLEGVEVIDVSNLPSESVSGHLYHIHNALVGHDLDMLLNEDLTAKQRKGLLQDGSNLWSISDD